MPARRLPWLKLWPEAMRHEKVALLSDSQFRTWICVLAASAEQPIRGRFASLQHAVVVTGRPSTDLQHLLSVGLLDYAEGALWVHDWNQWQDKFPSDFGDVEHSANGPAKLREHSANAPSRLPPDTEEELRVKSTEGRGKGTLHPNPPPQAAEGTFPQDVMTHLSALGDDLDAAAFHDAVESVLGGLGFACWREQPVPNRGDGHAGRLDLVAARNGVRIAFELDDRTPRRKSLTKLAAVNDCQFRVVVLRCPTDGPLGRVPAGITVIEAGSAWDQRRRSSAGGGRASALTLEVPADLTPPTEADRALWDAARDRLTDGWLPANAAKAAAFEPLGRDPSGWLWIRAPAWAASVASQPQLAACLVNAGDPFGQGCVMVEGT